MKNKRPHPITVWKYLSRFSFLLIFPLVQLLLREPLSVLTWSNLPWAVSVTVLSVMQYLACSYSAEKSDFRQKSGIIWRKSRTIPNSSLNSCTIRVSPFTYLFGAAQLRLDTAAGNPREADAAVFLWKKPLLAWWRSACPKSQWHYKAKASRVFLMAASWSNPASGLFLLGLFFHRAASLLGDQLSEQLYSTVDQSARLVALGLPPFVAGVGYLLLLGWLIAFLRQLSRYLGLKACNTDQGIAIFRGFPIRVRQLFSRRCVRAVSIRQTLLMKCLKIQSFYLHTLGSGKEKGDRRLLFAAAGGPELEERIRDFFPELPLQPSGQSVTPARHTWKNFLFAPLTAAGAIFALSFLLRFTGSKLSSLALILLLFPLWQGVIRLLAWKHTSLYKADGYYIVSCYDGLSLSTAYIPEDSLQKAVFLQNPIQKKNHLCSLRLYVGSETKRCFAIHHLDIRELRRFF